MNGLVILFAPEQPLLTLTEYHHQAWRVMQDWIITIRSRGPSMFRRIPTTRCGACAFRTCRSLSM